MCCLTILIYLLRDLVTTGTTQWGVFVQSFFFGDTIVDMGWYLQAQMVLYAVFFCVFKFAKKWQILWAVISIAVYCMLCAGIGLTETWYESALCFALGMFCAKYKQWISEAVRTWRKWLPIFVGFCAIFLVTLFLGNKKILPNPLRISLKMLSAIVFNILMVMFAVCIKLDNPFTGFLGKYSFEIYVLQGMFLYGYRPIIGNDWLYMGAVVASVIPLSLVVHLLFVFVSKKIASIGYKND